MDRKYPLAGLFLGLLGLTLALSHLSQLQKILLILQ